MKKTKNGQRFGSLLILAIVATVLVAGCGKSGTDAESAGSASKEQKGVTIVVASSANWTKDIDKKLAEQFKSETGHTIEFTMFPDDQYTNVLKTKFSTGEGPDVYLTQGGVGMVQFQPDQYALDLSGEPWVSRYTDWAAAGTTYNGKVIALNTWSVDGWGLLYDPALFKKLGLQVPTTYAEFVQVCEAIKAAGITPIYEPGKAEWHQEIWLGSFSAGVAKQEPDLYERLNADEIKFADLKGLETSLGQLKEIVDKGYFGPDFMAQTWEDSIDAMGSGKYAMMLVYSTFQNEVKAKFPDLPAETWEMFPVPLNDNDAWATSAGGIVRSINKNSKVVEAAKAYFNFLAQPENLKAFYAERPELGATSFKDVEGATTTAYASVLANSAGGTGLDFGGGVMYWDQATIGKIMQDLYLGGKTPAQVLEAIDAERAKSFK